MGIDGLLKLLDGVTTKEHISSFRGQKAAIDVMSWLYKGCYRCAFEHNQNIQSNDFLYYIFEMLEILSFYKITPVIVFDGRYVGRKDETIEKRKKTKEENRQKGLEFLEKGNEEEARKYLSRCIIIDDRIITLTMCALYTKGVEYMVAPYESDSQIAKLVRIGEADFAITEDSDLILYDVRVMLKLSQDGQCDFVDLSKWRPTDADSIYLKAFLAMNPVQRVAAGVLAGSDYNSSIKGIGIKRAIKHLSERPSVNEVISHLRTKKNYTELIPADYEQNVLSSRLIFAFATVYNPITKSLQYFNPELLSQLKPEEMAENDLRKIVGPFYEYDQQVRTGKVNARNLSPRQITKLDIKQVFSVNIYNLGVRQSANIKRREMMAQMRRRREEERVNLGQTEKIEWKKPLKPKKQKIVVQKKEFTEEEKKQQAEQRKAQKLQKFREFKNILQSFSLQFSSDSDSQSDSNRDERSPEKTENQKNKQSIRKTEESIQQNESEEDSKGLDLSCLNPYINPFAKNRSV